MSNNSIRLTKIPSIGDKVGKLKILINIFPGLKDVRCLCDCGKECLIDKGVLMRGAAKSCGCLRSMHGQAKGKKHTKIYKAYYAAKTRCENPNHVSYQEYGGRGIKLMLTFDEFREELGEAPSDLHSVDRIDNRKNYDRGNIRWSTKKEQCENRRNKVHLSLNGRSMNVVEWSKETGIPVSTIRYRIKTGLSPRQVLATKK